MRNRKLNLNGSLRRRVGLVEMLEQRTLFSVGTLPGAAVAFSTDVGADVADPVRDEAYIADNGNHQIIAIDTDTGNTLAKGITAADVTSLAVSIDDTELYAAEPSQQKIEVFNLPELTLARTLNLGLEVNQVAAAAHDRIIAEAGQLYDLDASDGTQLHTFPNRGLIKTNSDGTRIYSRTLGQSGNNGSLEVYDLSGTGAPVVSMSAPGPTGANSTDFALDETLGVAYYMDAGVQGVQMEDLAATTTTVWPFLSGSNGSAVAELQAGPFVFGMSGSDIEQFDQTGTVLNTYTLPHGANDHSLVITPNGNLIYTFPTGIGIVGISTLNIDTIPHLAYLEAPTDGSSVLPITPAIQVAIEDTQGNVLTSDTSSVTISIASGSGTIIGTTTVTAIDGIATFSDIMLPTGTFTLTASDGSYIGVTSAAFTISAPSIVYTAPANQSATVTVSQSFDLGSFTQAFDAGPFDVTVDWGDGSTVSTFAAANDGALSPQGHTYATVGNKTVIVNITDPSNTVTATGNFAVSVTAGTTASSVSVTSSAGTIKANQSVTLTAIVSPTAATGSVTFFSNSVSLGSATVSNGTAVLSTPALAVGSDSIIAVYSGDQKYLTSASPAIVVVVAPPPTLTNTSTILSSSSGSVTTDQALTLTALVLPATSQSTPITGKVSFFLNDVLLGKANVDGQGVASFLVPTPIATGVKSFTASYAGDASFQPSNSDAIAINVNANALVPAITKAVLPSVAVSGQKVKGAISARLTNQANIITPGANSRLFTANVFASVNTTIDPDTDILLGSAQRKYNVLSKKPVSVSVKLTKAPTTATAKVFHILLQTVDASGNAEVVDTGKTIAVGPAIVTLSAGFLPLPVKTTNLVAKIAVTNTGNVDESSVFTATIGLATDAAGKKVVKSSAGEVLTKRVLIHPGKSGKLSVRGYSSLLAELSSGSYYLKVTVTDASGNSASAVSATTVAV